MNNIIVERLSLLREVMRREKLSAFIFPSTDAHNGQYGTIVPQKDVSALATAIEALIESPQRVDAMMTNIERDYSDGDCSWSAIAQGIIDVYVDKLSAADK